MEKRKLVMELKLRGDTDLRVIAATRIKVDGRGRLLLYDRQSTAPANIWLRELQSFAIRRVSHTPSASPLAPLRPLSGEQPNRFLPSLIPDRRRSFEAGTHPILKSN